MENETVKNCSRWLIRVPLILVALFLLLFLCTLWGEVSFPLVMVLYALIVIGFITEVVLLVVCRKSHAKAGPAMFVLLIVALVALAFPQRNAEKTHAYDAAASSNLRNIQSYCESYFIDDMKYPDNLDTFGKDSISKDMQIGPANGVKTDYLPAKDRKSYIVTSSHPEGKKIFKLISDKPGMLFRLKKEPDSAYRPL